MKSVLESVTCSVPDTSCCSVGSRPISTLCGTAVVSTVVDIVVGGDVVDTEVVGAEVVDAEVVGDEVVDAEVVGDEVVDAEVVGDEVVDAEVVGDEVVGGKLVDGGVLALCRQMSHN